MKQLQKSPVPVFLNIYDFCSFNKYCDCIGLGIYHTAIQIQTSEYLYRGFDLPTSGVKEIEPKADHFEFSHQVLLGYLDHSLDLDKEIMPSMHKQFIGNQYDLLNNNCNHFTYRLAEMLEMTAEFPYGQIFRITNFFNYFRCCIPNCILTGKFDLFDEQNEEHFDQQHEHDLEAYKWGQVPNNAKYEKLGEESDDKKLGDKIITKTNIESGEEKEDMNKSFGESLSLKGSRYQDNSFRSSRRPIFQYRSSIVSQRKEENVGQMELASENFNRNE